jgi:DNA-directed RNA polymerase specialized sigma24 family protein
MPELVQQPGTDEVDDRELVRQALDRLPARQREVLLLRYYEDLSEAEIATRLGCAPGTVKSSAARALRALRDMLPEYVGPGAASPGAASSRAFQATVTAPDAPGPVALKSA